MREFCEGVFYGVCIAAGVIFGAYLCDRVLGSPLWLMLPLFGVPALIGAGSIVARRFGR